MTPVTLDVETREGTGRVAAVLAPSRDGSEASSPLFQKPRIEFTGETIAATVFRPIVRCTAALSAVTRHRGFMRFLGALSQLRYFDDVHCKAALAEDSLFTFAATDSYWGFYIYTRVPYERSLRHVFAAISDIDYQVLDCGANYGYWSVILSGPAYGRRNVVAVEASAGTFKGLQSNCALNGNRFQCVKRAVSGRSGEPLVLECRSHESAHICADGLSHSDARYCETVGSISLDDLCAMFEPDPARLVIKLDIEGHEIEALMSAECILNRDVLIIFEDHGLDPSARNASYLLSLGAFALYWVDDDGLSFSVSDIAEVRRIKKPLNYGYNFFAVTRDGEFHRSLREKLTRGPVLVDREARTRL